MVYARSALLERSKEGNPYSFSCNNDAQLLTLAFFLSDDCTGTSIDRYRRWALEPQETETGGNASWLCKAGDKIELSNSFDEQEKGNVRFSIEQFVHMLDTWKNMKDKHPKRVRISIESNKVQLELLESFETI